MSKIEELENRVKNLEGAMISLQNMIAGPNEEAAPAETEGKLLADLDPELAQLIEVYDANGETRVKCKQFIHKKNQWAEINTYLKERGFKWESAGKNSYWWRKT